MPDRVAIEAARWRPPLAVFVSIAVVSIVAWGAILLAPDSMFWDDWVIVNDDTLRMTRELGLPWIGYVFVALFTLGPWAFKVVVLVSTIVVGCATYAIAGRGLGLRNSERWVLAALVVSLPLFWTRPLASLSQYSMSIAAFFIAWYLLVRREPDQPGVLRYIGAAVLFFASYTTASLLPFTALPVAHHVFLVVRSKGLSRSVVGQFFARWWYVLAAPIAFWTIRTLFLQPYGLYLNYNQLTSFGLLPRFVRLGLVGLSVTLLGACLVLIYLFVSRHRSRRTVGRTVSLGILVLAIAGIAFYLEMTVGTASPLAQIVPAVLALSAAVLVAFAAREVASRLRGNSEPQPDAAGSASVIPTAAVGLIAFALGVLPYLLVGKVPTFGTWETRHQLLMPIGIAIIILAALRALNAFVPASPVRVASLALVCVFCAASFSASLALVTDWRKQMQITAELRNEPLVRDASTVVFIDLAPSLNYDSRPYSFYEYTGWMSTAFGNQKRIGVDPTSIGTLLDGGFVGAEDVASRYGFGEWTPSADGVKVEIVPVENASWWTLLIGEKSVTLRVTPIPELDSVR